MPAYEFREEAEEDGMQGGGSYGGEDEGAAVAVVQRGFLLSRTQHALFVQLGWASAARAMSARPAPDVNKALRVQRTRMEHLAAYLDTLGGRGLADGGSLLSALRGALAPHAQEVAVASGIARTLRTQWLSSAAQVGAAAYGERLERR